MQIGFSFLFLLVIESKTLKRLRSWVLKNCFILLIISFCKAICHSKQTTNCANWRQKNFCFVPPRNNPNKLLVSALHIMPSKILKTKLCLNVKITLYVLHNAIKQRFSHNTLKEKHALQSLIWSTLILIYKIIKICFVV